MVLAFGEYLDSMSADAWVAAGAAAWDAKEHTGRATDWHVACEVAAGAARMAAGDAAWTAAGDTASMTALALAKADVAKLGDGSSFERLRHAAMLAAWECVGISHLTTPAFFFSLFGITDVAEFARWANLQWWD